MNKYKICVYAISKNEERFVNRWFESMKEADEIYVLDTGSSDNTVSLLKSLGVNVKCCKIVPWRFDVARNKSLELVPKDCDICVCTDLDEVLLPGWRGELEKVWNNDTNRCKYTYNWSLDDNDKPIVSFIYEKIHSRDNFSWIHPVHEILKYEGNENIVKNENIILNHYPDVKKSRSSYLSLLELSVKEDPFNDRNMHYLGREYMYHKQYNDAIDTLIKHLSLKKSTWKDERCASMRFIARCYNYLNRFNEAKMWLDKAINEAPYLRDPYMERALLEYQLQNWDDVLYYCLAALEIKYHEKTYINEVFSWDNTVYDLLSLSYYYKNDYKNALKYVDMALDMDRDNERLINNKMLILDKIKKA